jgi:hypothetical protein
MAHVASDPGIIQRLKGKLMPSLVELVTGIPDLAALLICISQHNPDFGDWLLSSMLLLYGEDSVMVEAIGELVLCDSRHAQKRMATIYSLIIAHVQASIAR